METAMWLVLIVLGVLGGYRVGCASKIVETVHVDPNALKVQTIVDWLATLEPEQYWGAREMFCHLSMMSADEVDERVDKAKLKAGPRDGSWIRRPGRARQYHVGNGVGFALCDPTMPIAKANMINLTEVPEHLRCGRFACRNAWEEVDA